MRFFASRQAHDGVPKGFVYHRARFGRATNTMEVNGISSSETMAAV